MESMLVNRYFPSLLRPMNTVCSLVNCVYVIVLKSTLFWLIEKLEAIDPEEAKVRKKQKERRENINFEKDFWIF